MKKLKDCVDKELEYLEESLSDTIAFTSPYHLKHTVALMNKVMIKTALNINSFNQVHTAKALGMNRNTLRKYIAEYNIRMPK